MGYSWQLFHCKSRVASRRSWITRNLTVGGPAGSRTPYSGWYAHGLPCSLSHGSRFSFNQSTPLLPNCMHMNTWLHAYKHQITCIWTCALCFTGLRAHTLKDRICRPRRSGATSPSQRHRPPSLAFLGGKHIWLAWWFSIPVLCPYSVRIPMSCTIWWVSFTSVLFSYLTRLLQTTSARDRLAYAITFFRQRDVGRCSVSWHRSSI